MNDKLTSTPAPLDNTEKDPDDWKTGDDPMTGAQRSYLKTLTDAAHESFDETLTKAEASRRIDELRNRTSTAPEQESPLKSLGRSVSETVLGSEPDDTADTRRPGG